MVTHVRTGSLNLHGAYYMDEQLIEPAGAIAPVEPTCLAEAALKGMEALRQAVERKLDELNAMSLDELKAADLTALQRDLGKAVTQVISEEGKVRDAVRQQKGGDGIDFDAARAAIRGRLDRIRAAGCPGSIPGVADGE